MDNFFRRISQQLGQFFENKKLAQHNKHLHINITTQITNLFNKWKQIYINIMKKKVTFARTIRLRDSRALFLNKSRSSNSSIVNFLQRCFIWIRSSRQENTQGGRLRGFNSLRVLHFLQSYSTWWRALYWAKLIHGK